MNKLIKKFSDKQHVKRNSHSTSAKTACSPLSSKKESNNSKATFHTEDKNLFFFLSVLNIYNY